MQRPLVAERRAPAPPRTAQPTVPQPSREAPRPPQPVAERQAPAAPAPAPVPSARPEKRISTMNEAQIMEKLRSVVSPQDPSTLYAKHKKVGQG